MISWIKGRLHELLEHEAIIDAQGVGYALQMGPNQLLQLQGCQNTEIERYVYTLMREDSLRLFGFESAEKRQMFEKLLSVSGVGPKAAVAILDLFAPDQLVGYIQADDERPFQQVPGIGKKTAQRILLDLKGKFKDVSLYPALSQTQSEDLEHHQRSVLLESRSALMNLGFMEKEADMVMARHVGKQVGLDELIRLCLLDLRKN